MSTEMALLQSHGRQEPVQVEMAAVFLGQNGMPENSTQDDTAK